MSGTNPAVAYLPLLSHNQGIVRRQACVILLGTHGQRALTYLRRLLEHNDASIRRQALRGLQSIAEFTDLPVQLEPFAGMYIECLGRVRVYIGNHEVQPHEWMQPESGRAGWQKVQSLFAYLLHCGRRGATRKALGTAIWGASFSSSSLSRTLSALRHILIRLCGSEFVEQHLLITEQHCVLVPNGYTTDVQLFEQSFEMAGQVEYDQTLEAAVPLYQQAVQLYGGPYMLELPPSNTWVRQRRDMLTNDFVIAIERLVTHNYHSRRYAMCVQLCRRALEADETAEEITAWLLRSFAALNLRADLEHSYRAYLRSIALDAERAAQQRDLVVETYRELTQRGIWHDS